MKPCYRGSQLHHRGSHHTDSDHPYSLEERRIHPPQNTSISDKGRHLDVRV